MEPKEINIRKKRMRTINDSLKMIKAEDPDTAITYHCIKKLCSSGNFTVIKVGKKVLINFDELLETLKISEA